MELGLLLKQARMEAGLSQRQLCGDVITRNMLSQIENGSARPSMDTLRYLAGRLGKPVSYFLEEEAAPVPNLAVMQEARRAYRAGDFAGALKALEAYREQDDLFGGEKRLLESLACLSAAEAELSGGRRVYAAELLALAEEIDSPYVPEALRRRLLLLKAKLSPQLRRQIAGELPGLDEELLLRAGAALDSGDPERCAALLEAAEDREDPDWNFLRGEAYLAARAYREAAACYHKAEAAYPEKTAPRLERCYRELEDYKRAYEYACKQR